MARVEITALSMTTDGVDISPAGANWTAGDSVNGHKVALQQNLIVLAYNSDVSAHTIDWEIPLQIDGGDFVDPSDSIPASEIWAFRGWLVAHYEQKDAEPGYLYFNVSDNTVKLIALVW